MIPVRFGSSSLELAVAAVMVLLWWSVVLWSEKRRRTSVSLRRVFGWFLAGVALWLLFAAPAIELPTGPVEAGLVTDGASEAELQRLVELVDRGYLFSLVGGDTSFIQIPDTGWLARHRPEIERLHVAGAGLESFDLENLPFLVSRGEDFRTASQPAVVEASWSREVVLGHDFVLQGRLGWPADPQLVELHLAGPGGLVDSLSAEELIDGRFALTATPPRLGPTLYFVQGVDADGELLFSEPVGVSVVATPARRVLWVQHAPSFESRHVKSWLRGSGVELAVRSRVSRGKYRTDTVNDAPRFGGFSREALARYDLIVTDRGTLRSIGARGRSRLLETVEHDGVGVLLVLRESRTDGLGTPFDSFDLQAVAQADVLRVRPGWADTALRPELEIAPRTIETNSDRRPLVMDSSGRVLAATRPWGAGQVAVSVLSDSFKWALQGEHQAFGLLWDRLLGSVGRRDSAPRWGLPRTPILIDRPLEASLSIASEGDSKLPRVYLSDSEGRLPLAARQDVAEPSRWLVPFWPRVSGWQSLELEDGDGGVAATTMIHVAGSNRWTGWQGENRRQAMTRATRSVAEDAVGTSRVLLRWQPMPRWPIFAVLLLCLSALWLDERFSAGRLT